MTPTRPTPFGSILVPLDGSPLAEQALPMATRIAGAVGGKLRLALVHRLPPAPLDPAAAKLFVSVDLATRKSERGYLRSVQTRLRAEGARLSSAATMTGAPGPSLAMHVREIGIDLVVMASHGRGGLRRAWLGSVADYLVRHLEVPVLLVRPSEPAVAPRQPVEGQRILVPLDGSGLAEEALGPAGELARAWGAELSLIQVVSPASTLVDGTMPLPSTYDTDLSESWRAMAQTYVDEQVARLRGSGLRATGAAVVGSHTVDTLLEITRSQSAGLIAIATHGRGGLKRLALGSVADKLVRAADVPVLVYRPRGRGRSKPRAAQGRRPRTGRR
jgi:nucleotide-binding universal stress UspA family protein